MSLSLQRLAAHCAAPRGHRVVTKAALRASMPDAPRWPAGFCLSGTSIAAWGSPSSRALLQQPAPSQPRSRRAGSMTTRAAAEPGALPVAPPPPTGVVGGGPGGGNDDNEPKGEPAAWMARAAVFAAPMLWASNAPIGRYIYSLPVHPGPEELTAVKFAIAAAACGPVLWKFFPEMFEGKGTFTGPGAAWRALTESGDFWKFSISQAAFLGFGNLLVAHALLTTTASKGEFVINSGKLVFVPLIAMALGNKVSTTTLYGVATALVGVSLIFSDGALGYADLAFVVASMCYSTHTARVSASVYNPLKYTAAEMVAVAVLSSVVVAGQAAVSDGSFTETMSQNAALLAHPEVALSLLAMGAGATTLPMICMTFGQSKVSAAEAQVVYSTQPVWASIYSILLMGEGLLPKQAAGAAIVLASSIGVGVFGKKGGEGDEAPGAGKKA